MKKAIIFGGCGYIGINYAEFLVNKNEFEKIYLADIQKPTQNYLTKKFDNLISTKKFFF